jgi:hypothetical protein
MEIKNAKWILAASASLGLLGRLQPPVGIEH